MMNTRVKFALEDFQVSVNSLYVAAVVNLGLLFLLSFPDFSQALENVHIQACFISAVLLITLRKTYSWENQIKNALFLGVYFLVCYWEYMKVGLPAYAVNYDFERYRMGKGIMVDMFLWCLPLIYAAIRVAMGFTILWVVLQRKKYMDLVTRLT